MKSVDTHFKAYETKLCGKHKLHVRLDSVNLGWKILKVEYATGKLLQKILHKIYYRKILHTFFQPKNNFAHIVISY